MLNNYFKEALRYLGKDKLYTFINLTGLSAGIACCVIIFLFVYGEIRYDRFHKDADKIYRLTTFETNDAGTTQMAHSYIPMASLMQSAFPDIRDAVRMLPYSVSVTNKEKNVAFQEDKFFFVDSTFFRVFSFQLISGDANTVLNNPGSILMTQSAAEKYFGKEDAVGKLLSIEGNLFTIAGVLENIPGNSSLQFNILAPLSSARTIVGTWIASNESTWYFPPVYTFFTIEKPADARKIDAGMNGFEQKFLRPDVAKTRDHRLQPLNEVHFSSLEAEMHPSTSKTTIVIFITIALLTLIIAAINFINLLLSRIMQRLRGIGIRKVVGATNRDLWWQSATETGSFLIAAIVLSALVVKLVLPVFNSTLELQLSAFSPDALVVWGGIVLLIGAIWLIIPMFPMKLLSAFSVVNVLKRENVSLAKSKPTFSLQSFLVVFQFVICIALIAAALIIQSQLSYIQTKDIGFKRDQQLVIPVRDEKIQENFASVKQEILRVPGVSEVSALSNFPWVRGFYDFNTLIYDNGRIDSSNAFTLLVDEDFIRAMQMKIVDGRAFSKDFSTDKNAFIINESAAKNFGITSVAGVKLTMQSVAAGKPKEGNLIGIVKDFHFQSLHHPVEPLILTIAPQSYYLDNMIVRVSSSGDISSTLKQIESAFKKVVPDRPFDYFFLQEAFDKLYRKEMRLGNIFNYFSILAILISCLGLFGISSSANMRRVKEIGIRKVLGASSANITAMLSQKFLKLVLIAAVIAIPFAWWMMDKWLQNFAYKINISWWVFGFATLIALVIALVTISFQTIKASMANPVSTLRSE
ncbi:MAG TPA: ABC transporter permease [Chitinophagaceae bacterium]|nr:ABC transporter permease [Chitinophagaceae bacterium]